MQTPINGFIEREAKILEWCAGRRVVHLGCIGTTDYQVSEKVAAARESLHSELSAIAECVGVDNDSEAAEAIRNAGITDNIVVGDAENLAALAPSIGKFDVALAGDIIEHLSNPGLMLDGVKSLLNPGASLIISTPNALGLPNYVRHLRGKFREGLQHVLTFNLQTLRQLIERHGWKLTDTFTCYQRRTPRGCLYYIGGMFLRMFPAFGGTLLVRCQLNPR